MLENRAFLTVGEFAILTGWSKVTVRRWVGRGLVKAVKMGKSGQARLLIPASELERLVLAKHRVRRE